MLGISRTVFIGPRNVFSCLAVKCRPSSVMSGQGLNLSVRHLKVFLLLCPVRHAGVVGIASVSARPAGDALVGAEGAAVRPPCVAPEPCGPGALSLPCWSFPVGSIEASVNSGRGNESTLWL